MPGKNYLSFIDPSKSPFFYGYVVLIIGTVGVYCSIPGQTIGVSVFTDPVKDALGLSRNQFSNIYDWHYLQCFGDWESWSLVRCIRGTMGGIFCGNCLGLCPSIMFGLDANKSGDKKFP